VRLVEVAILPKPMSAPVAHVALAIVELVAPSMPRLTAIRPRAVGVLLIASLVLPPLASLRRRKVELERATGAIM